MKSIRTKIGLQNPQKTKNSEPQPSTPQHRMGIDTFRATHSLNTNEMFYTQ